MKITAFLLFAACLQVSAKGIAQKVTIHVKDAPIKKVFNEISKQTGVSILCDEAVLNGSQPVTIDLKDATVQQALEQALQNQGLRYHIVNNTIVVETMPIEKKDNAPPPPPQELTGKVTNERGEPISNATVTNKRTGRITITDAKGNFVLSQAAEGDSIIASYVGYAPKGIKIRSSFYLEFILSLTTNELDKVVIQGYGVTSRRFNTGNIATVTSEEIERQPVMNPLLALNGKIPGVIVTLTSGYASAPVKIEIRGRSSIADVDAEPLFVVDGVPLTVLDVNGSSYASGSSGFSQSGNPGPAGGQSPFFSINPQDIETITVLKDADATSIYGSRGANGVILINTKKGKASKPSFNISAYSGIDRVTRMYKMLNTQQYLEMRKEAYYNDSIQYGITAAGDPGNAYDILNWNPNKYTNWQKYDWGNTGVTNNLQMDLSGGDRQTTYRISGNYQDMSDILAISGKNRRFSLQSNLSNTSLNQRFHLSLTTLFSYVYTNLREAPFNLGTLPPNAPDPFDKDGKLNWDGWVANQAYLQATFSPMLDPFNSSTIFLNNQLTLDYKICKGLKFATSIGYSTNISSDYGSNPISAQNPLYVPQGSAVFGNTKSSRWIIEPQVEYNTAVKRIKINAVVGGSTQYASGSGQHVYGLGYRNDNLLGSISNAASITSGDGFLQYRYAALFGRANFNFSDKYIFNISARRDGSSRFGPGKQYGNFGAIGSAWILSEEQWFKKNIRFLSFAKLRASYGTTGSDVIGDYGYLTRWSATGIVPYQGNTSYVPTQLSNPKLQWQENKKFEMGLNVGFDRDRANLEVSYYVNRIGNQLVTTPLPIITGFVGVSDNRNATVQNSGLEATFNYKLANSKNIQWNISLTGGVNYNKLIAFPGIENSSYKYLYQVGKPLKISRVLHFTGVDPQTGLYTYEDKNHDGVIDPYITDSTNDLFTKSWIPVEGSFTSDFSYKQWTVNIFIKWKFQKGLPQAVYDLTYFPGQTATNEPIEVLDRWQKPGDHATYARFTTVPDISDYYFPGSDGPLGQGSYVRLQNLSISYSLIKKATDKLKIQACKFYLRGENLFLISKYKGPDPETPAFGLMPPSMSIVGGFQITF